MSELITYTIRNTLLPGDLGQVAALHGQIYSSENEFGIGFEVYVMKSLVEFYDQYELEKDKVWVVESLGVMVGFLLLIHRPDNIAQLRYFVLQQAFRGIGLGKKLMNEWMDFYRLKGYSGAYLYTTLGLDRAVGLYEKAGFKKVYAADSTNFGVKLTEVYYELSSEL